LHTDLKGRDNSEELGMDGKYIRMDVGEIGWEGVDWIHVAQNRDR